VKGCSHVVVKVIHCFFHIFRRPARQHGSPLAGGQSRGVVRCAGS
jgi:hypothetical protein